MTSIPSQGCRQAYVVPKDADVTAFAKQPQHEVAVTRLPMFPTDKQKQRNPIGGHDHQSDAAA